VLIIVQSSHKITHVLTAVLGVSPIFPNDFIYKNIPIRDIPDENIDNYFNASNEFISKALQSGGSVFVHCVAGASRSATLVAAFLMKEYGMTCDEAIKLLQKQRSCVDPNDGFKGQLRNFEESLQDADITGVIKRSKLFNTKTGKWIKRRHSI